MDNKEINHIDSFDLNISASDNIDVNLINLFYSEERVEPVITATLRYINERMKQSLSLPYFANVDTAVWLEKIKGLDIYITDTIEGRELNAEARGKDYATNILSYPSEIPISIIELMPILPLGELIICHDVVVREATEQEKMVTQHISHLLVHGILHLLGFDHELGQTKQDEMESFEIDILAQLNLPNPYL